MADFVFSKIPCFQHILLSTFRRMRLKYENYYLRRTLFYILKQQSNCKCLIAKTFDGNTFKMKSAGPVNKEQREIFLVVSRLDVHFGFDYPFFACPIERVSKVARPKSRAPRKKFVHPCEVVVTSNSLAKRSSFKESSFVFTQPNYQKLRRTVKRK